MVKYFQFYSALWTKLTFPYTGIELATSLQKQLKHNVLRVFADDAIGCYLFTPIDDCVLSCCNVTFLKQI